MNKNLVLKLKEALSSVLPITAIVFLLFFTIAPVSKGMMAMFTVGAILLIFGMVFFTLGVDISMTPMGERVGSQMTKTRNVPFIVIISFIIGFMITIAEPDLTVLANQVLSIPNPVIIGTVALGVGIFLVIALLRILFQVSLSRMLVFFYIIVFGLASITSKDFLAVAFDSGGVTTGPITVPFIMALGVGVASIRGDKSAQDDSFGLVALCSIGPILSVLILSRLYSTSAVYVPVEVFAPTSVLELILLFLHGIPHYLKEVGMALSPIVIFFFLFQTFAIKLPRRQMIRIWIGVIYTYIGLVMFLTGANIGFMPVGNLIGKIIASLEYNWILVPLGMIIGFFIVIAEPAVHVLNQQVETISSGAISGKAMQLSLSLGVSASVGIAMLRVLTGISIWYFLIPGYAIALLLSFVVPKLFTAIAFDSGGVASGPMTATFLLPLAMGACEAAGGNVMTDAFGVVAMVAMTPLIAIQILGFVCMLKTKKSEQRTPVKKRPPRTRAASSVIIFTDPWSDDNFWTNPPNKKDS
ncbi:MAG: DUF1538 domain-containing protein [Firmicutes bacterium]|nr:DUF1538 domain-containing protein [Bacillota bacterium]